MLSVYPPYQLAGPVCIELGMYIMAPEPNSTAYYINSSHQSVCLYVYPLIVGRHLLGKNVIAATNTHAIKKNCWRFSFLFGTCRIKGK
jgi:hypothetical protein